LSALQEQFRLAAWWSLGYSGIATEINAGPSFIELTLRFAYIIVSRLIALP
jgi:hypothetical protein